MPAAELSPNTKSICRVTSNQLALGRAVKADLEATQAIVHPDEPELRDVYGVIFWQEEGAQPLTSGT